MTEKAALIMREYVKHSLYDRVSTRPFLTSLEKKWITFQVLCALHQCHKQKICHGDIKVIQCDFSCLITFNSIISNVLLNCSWKIYSLHHGTGFCYLTSHHSNRHICRRITQLITRISSIPAEDERAILHQKDS